MFVKIKSIKKYAGKTKTKAFATVVITDGKESLTIPGFKVMDGPKGLFVGIPETKGKLGKFYKTVYPNKPIRDKIQTYILNAYKKA